MTQTVRDVFGVVVGAIKEGGLRAVTTPTAERPRVQPLREEQGNMKHVIGMERAMKELQDLMKEVVAGQRWWR
ncbi:MAG: hypothetical protein U1F43_38320 [Myxococcota bacterium]